MEEQVVSKLFEYSLVGGAFVYLLFFVTKQIQGALNSNAENNKIIAENMVRISDTLMRMDLRLDAFEKRLGELEGGE